MAKKATSKTAPVVKAAPKKAVIQFKLTGREYKPKAVQNQESWARVSKLLAKGPATEDQLHKVLQYGDEYLKKQDKETADKWPTKWKDSHERFLGYMMKGKDSSKHYIARV